MDLFEIYVLCENRSYGTALKFLSRFARNKTDAADDFPFPEYTEEPIRIYKQDKDIMNLLEVFLSIDPLTHRHRH